MFFQNHFDDGEIPVTPHQTQEMKLKWEKKNKPPEETVPLSVDPAPLPNATPQNPVAW